jgi:hypothetical protein
MKASDAKIPTFLNVRDRDELESAGRFNSISSGVPYTSDISDCLDSPELKLNGRCEKFDLTSKEDRDDYANLCAKFMTTEGCDKLWEQRVPDQNGGIVVYVAYVELSKVSYNTSVELKTKDKI